jgi:MSHA biogenesis protein MshL
MICKLAEPPRFRRYARALAVLLLTAGPAAVHVDAQVPSQPPGQPPLLPLAVTQIEERSQAEDFESTRPISLTFSEPVAIKDLLLLLVRGTNLSIVPDTDVEGSFIGELRNLTLRQALETVLQPFGLDYSVQDNVIRVFRRRVVTRIFDVNYVITRRTGSRALGASSAATGGVVAVGAAALTAVGAAPAGPGAGVTAGVAGASGGGSSAEVTGSDTGDMFAEFDNGLKTLLSADAKYNLDRKAGLLQVTDYPDRLDKVALYLEAVQIRVNRQVQIEARVIEIELRDAFAAGINWSIVLGKAGKSVSLTQRLAPSTSGVFTLGLDINDFNGLLRAFATQGKVNVLSSPKVMAMNNEPALMRVGTQDVFFVTTSQVDATTGRLLQTTVVPTPITEGVVLSVTPQIASDGVIHMNVRPSVTERTGQAVSRLGDTVPILSVREADTVVRVYPGETAVIAGLMQDRVRTNTTKVPLLGDAPVVGGLFRREEQRRRKTDLVILLTPTVVTSGGMREITAREQERLYESGK